MSFRREDKTIEQKEFFSSLICLVLNRAISSCLFISNHGRNKRPRFHRSAGRCNILAILIVSIVINLRPVHQQQFHYHPQEGLSNHALSDSEYKYNVASTYVFFEIIEPKELQYTYKISPAPFALPFNATFRDPIPLVMSIPTCGCGFLKNFEEIEGNIVLIERGECSFVSKAIRAQEAGAVAAIITGEDPGNDELYISMVDDETGRKVTIPTGFLLGKNGHYIQRILERHSLDRAMIRIPLNITNIAITHINQPPWLIW